jgi:ABC-type nitrate/sulfonate/bicarbonate transport system substrate-binding protein
MSGSTRLTRLTALALVALCTSALSGCGSSASGQVGADGLRIVRFGQVGSTATLWPVYVGQAKHFFADHKVSVHLSGTGSSAGTAQQIVAGAQDIGSAGLPDFVRAIDAGAPLELVASGVAQAPYTVIGGKGITSWTDLKGKKVILGGPKDVTRYYFDAAASKHGLTDGDFTFVYAGATSNRFAALSSGSVAAAILGPPFDAKAIAAGDGDLGKVAQYLPKSPFTGLAVSKNWAKQNTAVLVDFLRGFLNSITWLRNPANRAEAVGILANATHTTPDDAAATYDYYFTKIDAFPADGRISEPGLEQLLTGLASARFISGPVKPPSTYIDSEYVQNAAKNG